MAQAVSVLAIDPGTIGAYAVVDMAGTIVTLDDLPTHSVSHGRGKRAELDMHVLAAIIRDAAPVHAWLEQVGPMPKQGVTSVWRFGHAVGSIYGALVALGIPISFVRPIDWQRHHRIGRAPDEAIRRAFQLYPQAQSKLSRKKDQHRADALLIALYGLAQAPTAKDMLHAAD
jgi:crossover junction endodeoxyribonuclease RuvC